MSGRIVSYTYSEGPAAVASPATAAGATSRYQATNTIASVEQATPGTTTYARPAEPMVLSDLLAEWATQLSMTAPAGAPAGDYTFSYSTSTRRITLASTVAWQPQFPGVLARYLGFTQAISGYATSWVGASAPGGVVELLGVDVQPAEDAARVDLQVYRHGRAIAYQWGNVLRHRCTVYFLRADADSLAAWCVAGRVRIEQGGTGAYSATNVRGYVDGYVLGTSRLRPYGAGEDYLVMDLEIGVAR